MRWFKSHRFAQFKQISNGNYMGFIYEEELGPIPIGDWCPLSLGYLADGVTYEFPYGAQKIIELMHKQRSRFRLEPT